MLREKSTFIINANTAGLEMSELTQQYLKEIFNYDPETGILTWKVKKSRNINIGDVAGSEFKTKQGKRYLRVSVNDKLYFIHRIAWMYSYGEWPCEIDHKDGNGLNNKWENLRNVSRLENSKNQRKSTRNKSGIVGVFWDRTYNKWRAYIRVNGVLHSIGQFKSLFDAVCARKTSELEYYFHKNHGSDRPL